MFIYKYLTNVHHWGLFLKYNFIYFKPIFILFLSEHDILKDYYNFVFRSCHLKSYFTFVFRSCHLKRSFKFKLKFCFQINIAIESRETLINQRQAFKAIQAKLNDLASRSTLIFSRLNFLSNLKFCFYKIIFNGKFPQIFQCHFSYVTFYF